MVKMAAILMVAKAEGKRFFILVYQGLGKTLNSYKFIKRKSLHTPHGENVFVR